MRESLVLSAMVSKTVQSGKAAHDPWKRSLKQKLVAAVMAEKSNILNPKIQYKNPRIRESNTVCQIPTSLRLRNDPHHDRSPGSCCL